jgi:regulator of cell morphogenesis and NO signaling
MLTITSDSALGDIVSGDPSLARQLERLALDYCCGGARTIAVACAEHGLDAGAVVAVLDAARSERPAPGWTTMGLTELVDHIEETHLRFLWDELPRVTALMDKVHTVHGARHRELADVAACLVEVRADLEPHMLKEERVLFPMIRTLATAAAPPAFHCGTVQNPISVMLREHDDIGVLLSRLGELTDGYTAPSDGCVSYRLLYQALAEIEADTHLHVHKENNVLFPMVMRREAELAA